jgi:enoyl-CoA hydratase/carnithine racemase
MQQVKGCEKMLITKETKDSIVILTLSRPEVHHALNRSLLQTLSQLLREVANDPYNRVLIITSSGQKAFCVGADLKERHQMTEQEVRDYLMLIRQTFLQIEVCPIPVIAAISGFTFGGGLELALACDLRIADSHSQFAFPETSLGIIPGAGGTQRLTQITGAAIAKELIFTAKRFSAKEAYQYRIVHRVTEAGQALQEAVYLAEQIAAHAPLAIKQAKKVIQEGCSLLLQQGLEKEAIAYETLISSKDRLEGLAAFREKRKPNYRGE